MVQFARSLVSWLATSQTSSSITGLSVLSCSDSAISIAGGSLTVGEIFIRVENSELCRDDCDVLFREILSDEGNGVYRTAPASFAQVFPPETYDDSYRATPVETILPSCDHDEDEDEEELTPVKISRRFLEEERKYSKEDDDDDHYDDDYHEIEKSSCEEIYDATKKFIFDMYCIVRGLECTDYDPNHDDDDVYHDDDDDKPTKDDKGYTRRLQEGPSQPTRRMRGVKGHSKRRLQDPDPQVESEVVSEVESEPEPEPEPEPEGVSSTTVTFQGEDTSSTYKDSTKGSPDTDDHPDDDDFFDDDDYNNPDNGANFWKVLDAVFEYIGSIVCIVGGRCVDDTYDDDYHKKDDDDDDYDKKDKKDQDKGPKIRALLEIQDPPQYTSFWSTIFSDTPEDRFQPVPASLEEWKVVNEDGNCAYSKCTGVNSSEQCFERQSLVADTCRDSLEEWFALPATGEDNVWSWCMDMACHGQDLCYASSIFEQTQCDQQFYRNLMQSCPDNSSVSLSSHSPLVTDDLYEHCPLVSILLYSQMHSKRNTLYDVTQEAQSLFESSGCH